MRGMGYSKGHTTPEFNLDKAKEYLAKTDYNGEEIPFVVGYENYKKIGVVYQEELKTDWCEYFRGTAGGQYMGFDEVR